MYKMTFDYHTHTTFSHGKGSIEDNVKVAIERGLIGIAISDHGPGHLIFGVKEKELLEMRKEIDRLKIKYPHIDIFLSVEANITYKGSGLDLNENEKNTLDFIIAGYHYGIRCGYCVWNFLYHHGIRIRGKALKKKNTEMTIKAIENNKIKILTHPGDKGPFDIKAIAKACKENDVLMEISTHHKNLTVEEIKIAANEGAKFVISSDAHSPHRVGDFKSGLDRVREAGIPIELVVNIAKE